MDNQRITRVQEMLTALGCALALGTVALCTTAQAQEPCFTVPVELSGPLESVRLDALGVRSEVHEALLAGERRVVNVPFGGGSLANLEVTVAAAALNVVTIPAASVAVVRASEATSPGRPPRGLARRGRPPVGPPRSGPGGARLLLVAGGVLVIFGVRRRAWAAAAVGVGVGLLCWVLPAPSMAGRNLRGLDGDLNSGRWIEVRSAHGELEMPAGESAWFDSRAAEPPTWEVSGNTWRLHAADAEVHVLRSISAPQFDLASGVPELDLASLWLRTADGRWSAHTAWTPGEDFPSPLLAVGADPPGWLASGLPQGVPVIVGLPVGRNAVDWLRITGTRSPESAKRR